MVLQGRNGSTQSLGVNSQKARGRPGRGALPVWTSRHAPQAGPWPRPRPPHAGANYALALSALHPSPVGTAPLTSQQVRSRVQSEGKRARAQTSYIIPVHLHDQGDSRNRRWYLRRLWLTEMTRL